MKRRPWLFVVLCVAAIFAMSAWSRSAMNLVRARQADANDDLTAATRYVEVATRFWPATYESHRLAARIARRRGNLELAREHLAKCDDERERELLSAQTGELTADREAKLVEAAKSGGPDSGIVFEALARGHIATRNLAALNALVDQWPDPASGWRGRSLYFIGRIPEAIDELRRHIERHPEDDEARFELAHAWVQAGFSSEALRHSRFLAERHESTPTLMGLALSLQDESRFEEEIAVLKRVPGDTTAKVERGRALLRVGKPVEGERLAREAIAADDSNADAHLVLSRCLEAQGRTAEAKAEESRWQVLDAARYHLGLVMPRIASTNDPGLMAQAATCFLHLGQTEQMLEMCKSAFDADPDHRATHRLLAEHYERAGQSELARMHREAASKP